MEVNEVGAGVCATPGIQDEEPTEKATDDTNNEKVIDNGEKRKKPNEDGGVI